MKNWRTDLLAYLKLAAAAAFIYLKMSHGQELSTEDYFIIGALGLGGIGSKASADAKTVEKISQ
jgi:hypothetical protein